MDSIGIPTGDIWGEIRSRHSSFSGPSFLFPVYPRAVVHRQAMSGWFGLETLSLSYFDSLDCIPVAIQDEHEVLTMRSKLQLEVLLLVIEEERLHNFVIPQLEERFSGLSPLWSWVVKEGR